MALKGLSVRRLVGAFVCGFVMVALVLALFALERATSSDAASTSEGVTASAALEAQSASLLITVTEGITPVRGAFVAVTGSAGQHAGVTDSAGQVRLSGLATGTYTITAGAPGNAVGRATRSVVAGASGLTIVVPGSANRFRGIGAFGAQVEGIQADGKSGVFYLIATAMPSLYRTPDYGGNWAPVTISSDDPELGLDTAGDLMTVATSGFPGEVAVVQRTASGAHLYYSRDFGVTWQTMTGSVPTAVVPPGVFLAPTSQIDLYWGHAGGTSVVLVTNGYTRTMWAARMPTDEDPTVMPTLVTMTNSFKSAQGDQLAVGGGAVAPILGVAPEQGGSVALYELNPSPDRSTAPSTTITTGIPVSPTMLRLGGPPTGPTIGVGSVPNTALVYAASASERGEAVMATYTGTAWLLTSQTVFKRLDSEADNPNGTFRGTVGGQDCNAKIEAGGFFFVGSVAPVGSAGNIASCWVTQSGITLTARPVSGLPNAHDSAFDAGYDGQSNQVLIVSHSMGAMKSAGVAVDATGNSLNRPYFPQWPTIASAGTLSDTGGVSFTGLNAGVVRDTAFGPTHRDIVVAFDPIGGGRVLGTADGGSNWTTLFDNGAYSVDWWPTGTASSTQVLAGPGGDVEFDHLLGIEATGSFTTGARLRRIPGTTPAAFGLSGRAKVDAIRGISGTTTAFVATSYEAGSGPPYTSTLSRVALNGLSTAPTVTLLLTLPRRIVALDYCPAVGSAATISDTLFAAVAGTDLTSDGQLLVVRNASSALPQVTSVVTGSWFTDVRATCSTGTVWAARRDRNAGGTSYPLLKSTDGGTTFTPVTISRTGWSNQLLPLDRIETLAINRDAPNEVVAVSPSGDIISTRDGGKTWSFQNDTSSARGRRFGGQVPGDIKVPPQAAARASGSRGQVRPLTDFAIMSVGDALLGSGAGLFSASVWGTGESAQGLAFLPVVMPSYVAAW